MARLLNGLFISIMIISISCKPRRNPSQIKSLPNDPCAVGITPDSFSTVVKQQNIQFFGEANPATVDKFKKALLLTHVARKNLPAVNWNSNMLLGEFSSQYGKGHTWITLAQDKNLHVFFIPTGHLTEHIFIDRIHVQSFEFFRPIELLTMETGDEERETVTFDLQRIFDVASYRNDDPIYWRDFFDKSQNVKPTDPSIARAGSDAFAKLLILRKTAIERESAFRNTFALGLQDVMCVLSGQTSCHLYKAHPKAWMLVYQSPAHLKVELQKESEITRIPNGGVSRAVKVTALSMSHNDGNADRQFKANPIYSWPSVMGVVTSLVGGSSDTNTKESLAIIATNGKRDDSTILHTFAVDNQRVSVDSRITAVTVLDMPDAGASGIQLKDIQNPWPKQVIAAAVSEGTPQEDGATVFVLEPILPKVYVEKFNFRTKGRVKELQFLRGDDGKASSKLLIKKLMGNGTVIQIVDTESLRQPFELAKINGPTSTQKLPYALERFANLAATYKGIDNKNAEHWQNFPKSASSGVTNIVSECRNLLVSSANGNLYTLEIPQMIAKATDPNVAMLTLNQPVASSTHGDSVIAIKRNPADKNQLMSASRNGEVRVWKTAPNFKLTLESMHNLSKAGPAPVEEEGVKLSDVAQNPSDKTPTVTQKGIDLLAVDFKSKGDAVIGSFDDGSLAQLNLFSEQTGPTYVHKIEIDEISEASREKRPVTSILAPMSDTNPRNELMIFGIDHGFIKAVNVDYKRKLGGENYRITYLPKKEKQIFVPLGLNRLNLNTEGESSPWLVAWGSADQGSEYGAIQRYFDIVAAPDNDPGIKERCAEGNLVAYRRHIGPVMGFAEYDGKSFVTIGQDGRLIFWNKAHPEVFPCNTSSDPKIRNMIDTKSYPLSLASISDKKFVVTGDVEGRVRMWFLGNLLELD